MTKEDILHVEAQIGYVFDNKMLLQQAFIRKSYSQEHRDSEDNEVLEFIGDKALDLSVMKTLTEFFGGFTDGDEFYSEHPEGKLTELKRKLVESKMLAHRIDLFGFQNYLIMGKGDIKNNVQEDAHVKEDLFEAIIGAVTLDCGWNIEIIQQVVGMMLDPDYYLENGFDDENNYVALVQQWHQKEYDCLPIYEFKETKDGYRCRIKLDGFKTFTATGYSKSEARMTTAELVYDFLEDNNLLFSMSDEIGEPLLEKAVSQLHELAQKGYFSMPEYYFEERYDRMGNPIWMCECVIEEYETSFVNTMGSKKEAKRASAYEMLLHVLEMDEE